MSSHSKTREESHDYDIPRVERPPLAVVGSQISRDEQLFGRVFDAHVVRRFAPFIRPYRKQIIFALVGVLLFTATQLAVPLVIRTTIDEALVGDEASSRMLYVAAAVFGVVILVNYAANYVQERLASEMGERVLFDMRRSMFEHLQRISLSFMDKTEVGRLMSRLQGDVHALQQFLESSIFAVGDVVLLTGIIAVILTLHLELGLLTLAIVPVLFLVRFIWLPRARNAFIGARHASSTTNGALAEGINGVRTVQAMAREDTNYVLFDEKAQANLAAQLRATRFAQIMIPIVDTLTGIAMAVVIIIGGTMVLNQTLELGIMVAFIFYVQRFFAPIRSITMQYSIMQRAMASGHRIFEVLDVNVDVADKPAAHELTDIEGKIEFRNVTFGYEPDRPILNNVSFTVNPGETVALVGPTGSGKTSLTALAHRFYDIWDGKILIDGHDVRDVTQKSLGDNIAMVLQEPFLFTGTILENIRYRTVDATMEQIEEAAKAVGAHELIVQLPDGYDTRLEQGGGNLSQGQRQLISFARALVADSKILVLDEATANIDSYTEKLIQKALKRLLQGRTGLVIAHRLSTIRGADRIVVLQDGEVVEIGNHEELMERKGLYAKLYSMNYASFDDIPDELVDEVKGDQSTT
ncbi:MAG: ABC transporter ATP-binding protein [Spirochaetota bacterium]